MINLVAAGAVGDGITDNYSVIQTVCNNVTTGSQLYLPAGNYLISNTIDFGIKGLRLVGDGQGSPGPYVGGTRLFGVVNGPLIKCSYPNTGAGFADLRLTNGHLQGIGLQIGGVNTSVERVSIDAFFGLWAPENTFMLGIRSVVIRCPIGGAPLGSIGIQIVGHSSISAADVVGYDHGIRVAGIGNGIRDVRLEVNRIGLILGMNAVGPWAANAVVAESLSLEANDIGIYIRESNASKICGFTIQGTANSPSNQSKIGLLVEYSENTVVENGLITNSYDDTAIRIIRMLGRNAIRNIKAQNQFPTGKVWETASTTHWGSNN